MEFLVPDQAPFPSNQTHMHMHALHACMHALLLAPCVCSPPACNSLYSLPRPCLAPLPRIVLRRPLPAYSQDEVKEACAALISLHTGVAAAPSARSPLAETNGRQYRQYRQPTGSPSRQDTFGPTACLLLSRGLLGHVCMGVVANHGTPWLKGEGPVQSASECFAYKGASPMRRYAAPHPLLCCLTPLC